MNQSVVLDNILKYLTRFSEEVRISNAAGTFHLNIHAENLLVGLLNATYGLKLVNLNHSERGNYPAIDLLDEKNGVAFQVTSTPDMTKIKETIAKYFAHRTFEKAPVLKIYMLTRKIGNSQAVIDKFIVAEKKKLVKAGVIAHIDDLKINFSVKANIIDKDLLFADLNASNDLLKIKKVEKLLEQQFELIREANDLSGYHDELQRMYYEVVMNDEKGMTLDQVYVEPGFSMHYLAFGKKNLSPGSSIDKFLKVDHQYKIHEFLDDYLAGNNPFSCIDNCGMFLILGYPGQGKSSFLKRFMHDYIQSGKEKAKPVYYFQLRSIRDVKGFIYNPLEVLYKDACLMLGMELNRHQFNRSFLLLDGLDELYMRDNLKLEEIDRVCKELIMLTEKYPQLNIIITSRYGYVDDEQLLKEKLLIIQLEEFNADDQIQWLDKFKTFHSDTWLTNEKIEMFNNEYGFRYIRELISQPILLHMMASINQEIDAQTNRASIYSRLFTELIDRRYSRDGQIESLKQLTPDDLRHFLRDVAFSIYQTGEEYITKNELLKLESTKEFLSRFPGNSFSDNIKGVMISFYFKEAGKNKEEDYEGDMSNYAIEFLHKSLKEYLVAEKIVYTIVGEYMKKKKNSGRYVIDDGGASMKVIDQLFAQRELSEEIKDYIYQIIQNNETIQREELCDRLLIHLEYYLRTDFMYDFHPDRKNNPIRMSCNCFSGLWSFVSILKLRKNYLVSPIMGHKFLFFVKYCHIENDSRISGFDFSYQDFHGASLDAINFSSCIFYQTNFSHSRIRGVLFSGCVFEGAQFAFESITESHLFLTTFSNCTFVDTNMDEIQMQESTFSKCKFTNTQISALKIIQSHRNGEGRTIVFNSCIFDSALLFAGMEDLIHKSCSDDTNFDGLMDVDKIPEHDNEELTELEIEEYMKSYYNRSPLDVRWKPKDPTGYKRLLPDPPDDLIE